MRERFASLHDRQPVVAILFTAVMIFLALLGVGELSHRSRGEWFLAQAVLGALCGGVAVTLAVRWEHRRHSATRLP